MRIKKYIRSTVSALVNKYRISRLKKAVVNTHHDVFSVDKSQIFDARKYGFSFSESKTYQFPKNDYKEYISTWEAYRPRLKKTPYSLVSDDKFLFSLVFKDVVDVPEIYATVINGKVNSFGGSGVNNDNLYDFIVEHNGAVIKDRNGSDGFGILIFSVENSDLLMNNVPINQNDLSEEIKDIKNAVVQKKIVQGTFENQIYDRTINTVRIISLKKKDSNEHEIVAAIQRIGTSRSYPVDNFSQGGGSALIDIETGELSAMTCFDSFDDSGNRIFYDRHPDSGTQIKGTIVPNWENIKDKIVEITRELPLFDYVAWDVVVKDDGIGLVEINTKSTLKVFQVHGGMRNSYLGQKYLEYGYLNS